LLRLSGLDISQFNLFGVGSLGECAAQIFRLVVTPDAGRFAAPIHDLVKGTDNALGGKREVHLDAQRLAVEIALDVAQVQKASPETPSTIYAVELLNEKILLLIALGFRGISNQGFLFKQANTHAAF